MFDRVSEIRFEQRHEITTLWLAPLLASFILAVSLTNPIESQELVEFDCVGQAFVVQDVGVKACEIDQIAWPFTVEKCNDLTTLAHSPGELNNIGYRSTEDLLYGLELTADGNDGIVRIDSTGATEHYGYPDMVPLDQRFDAGDLSPDGATMYINRAGFSPLYIVDLDNLTTTVRTLTGATGLVHDWAAHPTNGLLYGGDSTDGQLAVLNPQTGIRTDKQVRNPLEEPLPTGIAYGAAWFDPLGTRLYLYRNETPHGDGMIFVIENIDGNPALTFGGQVAPQSVRNDGAYCHNPQGSAFGDSFCCVQGDANHGIICVVIGTDIDSKQGCLNSGSFLLNCNGSSFCEQCDAGICCGCLF